jgi:peptidoglycan/LPS O-acetylase OafA/YrhL
MGRTADGEGAGERQVKTRYETLDGLRGAAAIAVLLYHFSREMGVPLLGHGYLAVDFFFALSGFVIAASYEDRLRTELSVSKYMIARLVRLGPMIVLGAVLGGLLAIMARGSDPAAVTKELVLGLLLIPIFAPRQLQVYPLNPPSWSLAAELLVNAAHAVVIRYLTTPRLAVLVTASGALLVGISRSCHSLDVGADPSLWWLGPPRAAFSFSAGVLLFRLKDRISFAGARPWTLALALLICLTMPKTSLSWIYDPICAIWVFPLIVLLGSRESIPAQCLARVAGVTSYPLYAIHYPIVLLFGAINRACGVSYRYKILAMALETVVILFIAAASMTFYETPARLWLRRLLMEKAIPLPEAA